MAGERRALLIATDAYTDPGLTRLRAPTGDVRALADVLADPSIGGFYVRQLLNRATDETKQEVEGFFDEARLNDLLFRHSTGSLNIAIPVVVSNHLDAEPLVRSHGIEFRHIPVTPDTKADAEAQLMKVHDDLDIHLVVLARYMQVLSDDVCRELSGQAINIHHSFLPSFKGARPYQQAFERGVKLIGATAHYVTADLDEGPIIEQDVERVSHTLSADDFTAVGLDIESRVLARAVRWHVEHRVLLNGHKSVIFR